MEYFVYEWLVSTSTLAVFITRLDLYSPNDGFIKKKKAVKRTERLEHLGLI